MAPRRFDALARSLAGLRSRRSVLTALAGGAFSAAVSSLGVSQAEAARKRSVGNSCRVNADCASNRCVSEGGSRKICHCGSVTDCPGSADQCRTPACLPNGACGAANKADGTSCGVHEVCCGGACVDTASDPANCGNCAALCPSPASCQSGQCLCPGTGKPPCHGGCCTAAQQCNETVQACARCATGFADCGTIECCAVAVGEICVAEDCCRPSPSACAQDSDCCSDFCFPFNMTCGCRDVGAPCQRDLGCCNGNCDVANQVCACNGLGGRCANFSDCCTGICDVLNTVCACRKTGQDCSENPNCCGGSCNKTTHLCN